jgi:hypothetical protein
VWSLFAAFSIALLCCNSYAQVPPSAFQQREDARLEREADRKKKAPPPPVPRAAPAPPPALTPEVQKEISDLRQEVRTVKERARRETKTEEELAVLQQLEDFRNRLYCFVRNLSVNELPKDGKICGEVLPKEIDTVEKLRRFCADRAQALETTIGELERNAAPSAKAKGRKTK